VPPRRVEHSAGNILVFEVSCPEQGSLWLDLRFARKFYAQNPKAARNSRLVCKQLPTQSQLLFTLGMQTVLLWRGAERRAFKAIEGDKAQSRVSS